ncbi:MAG: hypothetical protein ABIA62_04635 [Candidatus Woesearchaeota archaeon]
MVLFSLSIVYAAPAPWGIAINPETKECGGYWAGDEYVAPELPEGWKAYYPDYYLAGDDIIKTEFGDCVFRKDAGDAPGEEERCCNALGLNFVTADVGETGLFSYPMLNFLTIGIIVLASIAGLIWLIVRSIVKRSKKK